MSTKNKNKKIEKTSIDAAKIEDLLRAAGYNIAVEVKGQKPEPMTALVQKGFVKVPGPTGRAIYIGKANRVTRVDLSGFDDEYAGEGVVHLGDEKFGAVHHQLNFQLSEDEILANLQGIITDMQGMEPVIKVTAAKKSKEAKAGVQGWSFAPPATEEEKAAARAAKKALLEKVASEKGVEVSSNA